MREYRRTEAYRAKSRERSKRRYAERSLWIAFIKSNTGCQICDERNPWLLHFHHMDNKEFQLSSNVSCSYDRLISEIEKCLLLCANCHARVTNDVWTVGHFTSLDIRHLHEAFLAQDNSYWIEEGVKSLTDEPKQRGRPRKKD